MSKGGAPNSEKAVPDSELRAFIAERRISNHELRA